MFDDLTISPAGTADVAALEFLVNSAYRGDSARQGWTHEANLLGGQRIDTDGITELLTNPANTILKVESQQQLVACMCLEKRDTYLYLGMLTVSPTLQAKGIGKKLLQTAEAYAAQWQYKTIAMSVITDRTDLIAWYERHGYINTGHTHPFPMHDPRYGLPVKELAFVMLEKTVDERQSTVHGSQSTVV